MKVKTYDYPKNVLEWIDDRVYAESDVPADLAITIDAIVGELIKDNELSERDAEVFYTYFKENVMQSDLASKMNISRERLRQIINGTCDKIDELNNSEYENALHNGLRCVIDKLREDNAAMAEEITELKAEIIELSQNAASVPNSGSKLLTCQPISALNLSTRTYNALTREGMRSVKDVMEYDRRFSSIAQLGTKSYRELADKFTTLGLKWKGVW